MTGSAQGLGKEFSRRLLRAGGNVIISDLKEETGLNTLDEFAKEFGKERVHFVRCDVTKSEDLDNLMNSTIAAFGKKVDIFVNNAGINTNWGWKKCMEVNILAVMSATEKAIAAMQNTSGCKIINIASIAGIIGTGFNPDTLGYYVSKNGVVTLSRTMALGKPKHGVDILCLCPAWADTEIVTGLTPERRSVVDQIIKVTGIMPVERVGEAFQNLMQSKNGTVLAIVANTPCFEIMDVESVRVAASHMMAKMIGLVSDVDVVHPLNFGVCMLVICMFFQFLLFTFVY